MSPWFVRLLLSAIAVVISHLFEWHWLRYVTSEANLQLDALAGLHLERITSDTVWWHGTVFRYLTACTFIDVWFGAIPLLWSLRRTVQQNLQFMFAFGVALFSFNVVRLSISDVFFNFGMPWWIAHDLLGAFAYFAVWCWIMKKRDWESTVSLDPQRTIKV